MGVGFLKELRESEVGMKHEDDRMDGTQLIMSSFSLFCGGFVFIGFSSAKRSMSLLGVQYSFNIERTYIYDDIHVI